jgi:hypothetical protein
MDAQSVLAGWENFYVIVGSSAGALTGLQFVVITLASDKELLGKEKEIRAFGTPTIVHFCAVLFLAALISAPWGSLGAASLALSIGAAAGLIYSIFVTLIARRQTGYEPVLEDWLFHSILPILAYAIMLIGAIVLTTHPAGSLFVIAAAAMLLLFIGIHNAWDAVIWFAQGQGQDKT